MAKKMGTFYRLGGRRIAGSALASRTVDQTINADGVIKTFERRVHLKGLEAAKAALRAQKAAKTVA